MGFVCILYLTASAPYPVVVNVRDHVHKKRSAVAPRVLFSLAAFVFFLIILIILKPALCNKKATIIPVSNYFAG